MMNDETFMPLLCNYIHLIPAIKEISLKAFARIIAEVYSMDDTRNKEVYTELVNRSGTILKAHDGSYRIKTSNFTVI